MHNLTPIKSPQSNISVAFPQQFKTTVYYRAATRATCTNSLPEHQDKRHNLSHVGTLATFRSQWLIKLKCFCVRRDELSLPTRCGLRLRVFLFRTYTRYQCDFKEL